MRWMAIGSVGALLLGGCAEMFGDLPPSEVPGSEQKAEEAGSTTQAVEQEEHRRRVSGVGEDQAARVQLFEAEAQRPSEALGVVDEREPTGDRDAAARELRKEAAALGADAVVDVVTHPPEHPGEPLRLTGMAVRYGDLVKNPRYEYLGQVTVHADLGDQESATERLRDRAAELFPTADLLVGLHYDRPEGQGSRVTLSASAIRYRP